MRKMIDMAKEAGMTGLEDGGLFDNFLVFEALVRADEREIAIERAFVAMLGASHELTLRVVRAIRAEGKQ
jgi:hypothetical protein